MKERLLQAYQIAQILSLDVALGALAGGSMMVWWLELKMPLLWWIALPTSVWVIYTLDHLLDAYRLKSRAHTARHLFHHRHFNWIASIWGMAFLLCLLVFPWGLPAQMVWFALGMGGLVLVHLGLVWLVGARISPFFHKELGVALIYTTGVLGGPLSLAQGLLSWEVGWLVGQFFVLALINLLAFSAYEHDTDELDGHTSFVRAIGPQGAKKLIAGLALVMVGIGSWFLAETGESRAIVMQTLLWGMLLLLAWISFLPRYFRENERYRLWGDLVFLIPALIWLC